MPQAASSKPDLTNAAVGDLPPPVYDEVIETRGVRIPFVPDIITPRIERPMRANKYEAGEVGLLQRHLRPDDRVLDLGAGVGLVSTVAAQAVPEGSVTAVEANPAMLPLIRETYRLNGVEGVDLRNAVVADKGSTAKASFFMRADFWASSMEPDSRPYEAEEKVDVLGIGALMSEVSPTVISCDIEGAELELFEAADLSGVRLVIVEVHPKVYGPEGVARVVAALQRQGLRQHRQRRSSTVRVFERVPAEVAAADPALAPWPPEAPRILAMSCMKDEGPFILEWLAWHKAMGLTDLYVFTNDCSDGTDLLLDRLEEMGELKHLPNPAKVTETAALQPFALKYMQQFRAFQEADFFISFDVDEFFNVRVGDGTFAALFEAVPEFDVLSVSEILHGANGNEHYRPGWLTEMFPRHRTLEPGSRKAKVGVKSIVRLSDRVAQVRNHRPDLRADLSDPVWLDGSGQRMPELLEQADQNGADCRGRYALASLEHFALRSLESFLVKMDRGGVVRGMMASPRYWRMRNTNSDAEVDLSAGVARARAYYQRFEADAELMRRHEACVAAHMERIAALKDIDVFRERRSWILENAWDDKGEAMPDAAE